jgi:hypothetical protein
MDYDFQMGCVSVSSYFSARIGFSNGCCNGLWTGPGTCDWSF